MELRTVIERLRAHRDPLRDQGVAHLRVFGSTARGDAGPGSDVDLAVEFDEGAPIGGFGLARLEGELATLLGCPVDLVAMPPRNARIGAEIAEDGVLAF